MEACWSLEVKGKEAGREGRGGVGNGEGRLRSSGVGVWAARVAVGCRVFIVMISIIE